MKIGVGSVMAIGNIEIIDQKIVPKSDDSVFKKPFAPIRKSRKLKILDEETYLQNLQNIVEKDFFPDLPKLKAQTEYLDAVEKNDVVKLRELHSKYATKTSPFPRPGSSLSECGSPTTFETPLRKGENNHPHDEGTNLEKHATSEGTKNKDKSLSLDSFLVKNTSEDNASFGVMMEEAKVQHQMKYSWLYNQEKNCKENQTDLLALPGIEKQAIQYDPPVEIDTWQYKNRNSLMYVPDGMELSEAELKTMQFNQRKIIHTNTRFQRSPFNEQANRQAISEAAQIQARQKEGKIGIDGKELLPAESPKINGYGFVKTPSPLPGIEDSPVMTWGEIEGTPFCLDGRNTPNPHTPGPTFHIPDVPARDKLAFALAEKARLRHRVKKQSALRTVRENLVSPAKSGTSEQLGTMSPAAQRLASSQLGIRMGTDKALMASYSPRPSSTRSTSVNTPQRSPQITSKSPRTHLKPGRLEDKISLTDDLLHIPKRPRASDFFVS